MLELYHNINSVCAQKVRIALEEKGQQAEEHVLTLRGDQNEPAYLKLNPSGVVPTLVRSTENFWRGWRIRSRAGRTSRATASPTPSAR